MNDKRRIARRLAGNAVARGEPLAWFEELYARASSDAVPVPWADGVPNPNLQALAARPEAGPLTGRALEVGCGYGDDAEWLAARGLSVTAFDIAPSAIARCRTRFPGSAVDFTVADLFAPPPEWIGAFDLVIDCYTLQVLPPGPRRAAIEAIARFVRPGGRALCVARGREAADPPGEMPWPLTRDEIRRFTEHGLRETWFEDVMDDEAPPVRRFRAVFQRASKDD